MITSAAITVVELYHRANTAVAINAGGVLGEVDRGFFTFPPFCYKY